MQNRFDIIVIGGGHAGVEASIVAARMGNNVALLTSAIATLCKPSCNPNIGGTAKGHLVKEIDALGGAQGLLADKAGIQFKMLNKSKGAAIWSPRAQIDKDLYPKIVHQHLLKVQENHTLTIIETTANEILVEHSKVVGCRTKTNETLFANAIVLCAGTFLNGKMFTGLDISYGGRVGEPPVEKISDLLTSHGIKKGRLKTGTPPRIHRDTIDYSKLSVETGDEQPVPFSYQTQVVKNQIVCHSTETNATTHDILRTGFARSPMYTGLIEGVGPRYCPSIEDKITRFAHRSSHKILLEPEALNTTSIYVNGYSTSLPRDVQLAGLRTITGLEKCEILTAGYAIEYDFFFPYQLKPTLETKAIDGLYFAGQINGTSGYEEAASQGLIAGINAALKLKNAEPFTLKRSEAYIGVLIDDLVNKSTNEPYRMFTSLAEYRLLLRQDNADERLSKYGYNFGIIPRTQYDKVVDMYSTVSQGFDEARKLKLRADAVNTYLERIEETPLIDSTSIAQICRRGKVDTMEILKLANNLPPNLAKIKENMELAWKLDVEIKYEGYIIKQKREVEYFLENENKIIPTNFDYDALNSLSKEALQKLKEIRPASLGQASRISGVSATDIAIISFYMKAK
ncbi:MAG: tRNA uridine-5-carboxymethylaminomethyl(34) synthesis enzyme MnmG [Ignavibacteria bacterium]|jgi:tRNA uridine 5-carboxymethylaminomethyl modification enzyme|nr:tRNA uridine-5-carboxymethylaminomethyl(34) synthesis enzyme MnmG [Ignavibacteria bacterium]